MKIEVKNVTKKFKNNIILDNINVEFNEGKIYGLIGENGSGKTVLMKLLCGFYLPSEGEILFDGVDYNKKKSFPPSTRALIEKPDFIGDLTGFENLKLLADIQKKINSNDIEKTLRDVNLFKDMNKKYKEYSLGMKQKLGIAQVLMEDSNVMILDEPFNGVESKTVEELHNLFKTIKKHKIIIISTHNSNDINTLFDEKFLLQDGKIKR